MISHFFAGECTERGRPVKALRCAPTAARRTKKRAGLTRLPLRSVCFQPSKKCEVKMGSGTGERAQRAIAVFVFAFPVRCVSVRESASHP